MMPGGMTSSGGYWGIGWPTLVFLVVFGVVAVIVTLLIFLRNGGTPGSLPTVYQSQSTFHLRTVNSSASPPDPQKILLLGEVVKSLGPTLMDDERRVMDEIAHAGGEVLQSDLPRLTGFSKATVSKAVHGLEVRAILVREKHKWTYWCKVNQRLIDRVQGEQPARHEAGRASA